MALTSSLIDLAREMLTLESETFEINDYEDDHGGLMLASTSTTSCSTSSSTTSTGSTSCS